jgi:hypothetical protein
VASISHLTSQQLRRAAALKENIEAIQSQLEDLLMQAPPKPRPPVIVKASYMPVAAKFKSKLSKAGKARIIAAQKLRWAKFKAARKKVSK